MAHFNDTTLFGTDYVGPSVFANRGLTHKMVARGNSAGVFAVPYGNTAPEDLTGDNEFAHTLLAPDECKGAGIPDFNLCQKVTKSVSYTATLTGKTEYLIWVTPDSRVQRYTLFELSGGAWRWVGAAADIVPDQNLAADFTHDRLVSMVTKIQSATVSTTNFTISGNLWAVSYQDVFHFLPMVSGSTLTPFRKDDESFLANHPLSDGVAVVADPSCDFIFHPTATPNAIRTVRDGLLSFYSYNAGAVPFKVLDTATNTPTLFEASIANGFIPFGLRGKTRFDISWGTLGLALANTPTNMSVLFEFTASTTTFSVPMAGNTVALGNNVFTGTFMVDTPDIIKSIKAVLQMPGGWAVQTASYLGHASIQNDEVATMAEIRPGCIIMINGTQTTQTLSLVGLSNHEVIPNATLARNLKTKQLLVDIPSDIMAAKMMVGNKRHFGIRSVYPLRLYETMKMTGAFKRVAERSYIQGHSAGLFDFFKPILRTAYTALRPMLHDGAQSLVRAGFNAADRMAGLSSAPAVEEEEHYDIEIGQSSSGPETKPPDPEVVAKQELKVLQTIMGLQRELKQQSGPVDGELKLPRKSWKSPQRRRPRRGVPARPEAPDVSGSSQWDLYNQEFCYMLCAFADALGYVVPEEDEWVEFMQKAWYMKHSQIKKMLIGSPIEGRALVPYLRIRCLTSIKTKARQEHKPGHTPPEHGASVDEWKEYLLAHNYLLDDEHFSLMGWSSEARHDRAYSFRLTQDASDLFPLRGSSSGLESKNRPSPARNTGLMAGDDQKPAPDRPVRARETASPLMKSGFTVPPDFKVLGAKDGVIQCSDRNLVPGAKTKCVWPVLGLEGDETAEQVCQAAVRAIQKGANLHAILSWFEEQGSSSGLGIEFLDLPPDLKIPDSAVGLPATHFEDSLKGWRSVFTEPFQRGYNKRRLNFAAGAGDYPWPTEHGILATAIAVYGKDVKVAREYHFVVTKLPFKANPVPGLEGKPINYSARTFRNKAGKTGTLHVQAVHFAESCMQAIGLAAEQSIIEGNVYVTMYSNNFVTGPSVGLAAFAAFNGWPCTMVLSGAVAEDRLSKDGSTGLKMIGDIIAKTGLQSRLKILLATQEDSKDYAGAVDQDSFVHDPRVLKENKILFAEHLACTKLALICAAIDQGLAGLAIPSATAVAQKPFSSELVHRAAVLLPSWSTATSLAAHLQHTPYDKMPPKDQLKAQNALQNIKDRLNSMTKAGNLNSAQLAYLKGGGAPPTSAAAGSKPTVVAPSHKIAVGRALATHLGLEVTPMHLAKVIRNIGSAALGPYIPAQAKATVMRHLQAVVSLGDAGREIPARSVNAAFGVLEAYFKAVGGGALSRFAEQKTTPPPPKATPAPATAVPAPLPASFLDLPEDPFAAAGPPSGAAPPSDIEF